MVCDLRQRALCKYLQHFIISALEVAKSQLETMEKRFRGSPSLTRDINGCIARINNHLLEYTVTTPVKHPPSYLFLSFSSVLIRSLP